MKRCFFSFIAISILLFSEVLAQSVTRAWVARYNAANSLDEASSLAIDNAGYIYVTGNSAGLGNANDYLTIKYNPDGTAAWITRVNFGVNSNDFGQDIVIDNASNVYVTGQGGATYATVKYNSTTGDTIWTKRYRSGPNTFDVAKKIAVDQEGNIYVTGTLNISANPATRDIGTIKYNGNGDSLWVKIFDGANAVDIPEDLFVDDAGNVYVTGRSDTLGPGDAITLKYDTNGELKWHRRFGTSGVGLSAVTVDDDGNVYVTGRDGNAAVTVKYDSSGVEQWVVFADNPLVSEKFVDIDTEGSNIYVFGSRGGSYMTFKYFATGDTAWTRFFSASGGGGLPQPFAITLDDFNNVYVTGRRGTPTSSSDYLTLKYSTFGTFQWSQEYNGPGNSIDEARDIGVDQSGNVYVTGASQGDTTGQDYATIKYGQPGGGSPNDCWLAETFDNLFTGSLNGQNEWFTVPGRSDAFVVANPFGAGQVLLMDAGPNETVIMGKYVNIQTGGTHGIKLDVLVDGNPNPAEPTLAKVEIRTTGNPNWDKKFQLYFGAHMRLNYGPTLADAVEFLSANDLVKGQWYQVEAVVDVDSNLVDIFLDGVLKLNDITVGPGAITDIGISAWDRPGLVYYDNLEFCRFGPPQPGECPVTSFFDVDDEGWMVVEDVQPPVHFASGGNPGGYISATDIGTGQVWSWQAPAKFLGGLSCAYDRALNFDLRHIANNHSLNSKDIVLEGAGLTLVYDTPYNPGENWTSYSVSLNENAGWKKDDLNGVPPTRGEMQAVLASLSNILIRGEFSPFAGDIGHLDNVILGGNLKGAGPLQCINVVIDDDNPGEPGDGDGRIEDGEFIRMPITLKNTGIETAAGISGTLSTEDPDIFFRNNASTWPDIVAGDTALSDLSFDFDVAGELGEEKVVIFTLNITAANGGPWVCTFDEVVSPENEPPLVVNPISDTTVARGDTLQVRDLNADPAVFHDPDQDLTALVYSVASDDSAKAVAMISGSILTLAGIDTGSATITVTADDGRSGMAQTSFTVEIQPPAGLNSPDLPAVVREFRLEQNYPNPFNPATEIRYALPRAEKVTIVIYNALGQQVKILVSERQELGYHTVIWDARNDAGQKVGSGMYFYLLKAGEYRAVKKMTLLK
jgi:hypothetical protein